MAKPVKNTTSLAERILRNSTVDLTATILDSKIFDQSTTYKTLVPLVNVALSGDINGGFSSGLGVIAGPSKHFKSLFAMLMIHAFLKKEPEGVVLFYDSEFGSPSAYFSSMNIDMSRVIHTPITDIEMLKHDIMVQLAGVTREDKFMIVIDSVGNLASKKEVEDAISGKQVTDMTRAKALKSLFRMVTPYLTIKDLPLIVVNHTYQTQEMFSKTVVGGGTGIYYSADWIWVIGRRQDKEGDDLVGYDFVINIEKSRHVVEKSKLPINVAFSGGIRRWSGMLDLAVEAGLIIKPSKGKYALASDPEKEYKEVFFETNNDVWKQIFSTTDFGQWLINKFKLPETGLINQEDFANDDVD